MSTLTTNYGFIKPALTDPANITSFNANWDVIDENLKAVADLAASSDINSFDNTAFATKVLTSGVGLPVVAATSGDDGVTYMAVAEGISTLSVGTAIIIVPDTTSSVVLPTLNLNGLGAKGIKQSLSANTATAVNAENTNWMAVGKPILVVYNGTNWVTVTARSAAADIYGAVAIENGGTGATTASGALANLGITYGTEDLTAGTSELPTGSFYFVYE